MNRTRNSWTRTLNLTDAHTLLALAKPGVERPVWERTCHEALATRKFTRARETGLIRLVRETFLTFDGDAIVDDLFLRTHREASVSGQEVLVRLVWALSNPVTGLVVARLVLPALMADNKDIPLDDIDALVSDALTTEAPDALRKTRTTLLGALEGIGLVATRGTGRHRQVKAVLSEPHPVVLTYLAHADRLPDNDPLLKLLAPDLAPDPAIKLLKRERWQAPPVPKRRKRRKRRPAPPVAVERQEWRVW